MRNGMYRTLIYLAFQAAPQKEVTEGEIRIPWGPAYTAPFGNNFPRKQLLQQVNGGSRRVWSGAVLLVPYTLCTG